MKADPRVESEVRAVLDAFAVCYGKRNLADMMALFVPDPDGFMYGTGADEKRIGPEGLRAQVERDWSQSETLSMTFDWVSISAAGPVAWVASEITFRVSIAGTPVTLPTRLTIVLENRGGRWLIAQTHFSAPASAQPEGESFPR